MAASTTVPCPACATHEISGRVAYLIGIDRKNIYKNPVIVGIYDELKENKNARIIRNLCSVRTSMFRHFSDLVNYTKYGTSSLYFATEFIPVSCVNELDKDGVELFRSRKKSIADNIIEINRFISDKINLCQSLFPLWLDWSYLRDIFIMPDGLSANGVMNARSVYVANKGLLPFQSYINWKGDRGGNILFSDKVFVTALYQQHGEKFDEYNKVGDADSSVKTGIYDFIEGSNGVIIAVDCENSDPYKMCATLAGLDRVYTEKISKIILISDVNASSAWKILESYTSIPIEYKVIERILKSKSLVDITLSSAICKEHYKSGINSFILFSSDSDYWGLSSSMPEADFYIMVERKSVSSEYCEAIEGAGMKYCYIDDFFSGNSQDIKFKAILQVISESLKAIDMNANQLLDGALKTARADMSEAERKQFYDKYLKRMSISLDETGKVLFSLGN